MSGTYWVGSVTHNEVWPGLVVDGGTTFTQQS
jgi:hypothetical protein